MMKSPLMIGGVMDEAQIPADSLTIMSNTEIIAINQDPLGKAASLILRDTEAQWDVWAGELSEGKKVLGVANWLNETQTVSFDLAQIGVGSATAHDVWAGEDVSLSGLESFELQPHELRTLVLRDIETVDEPSSQGYHAAADALLAGSATTVTCADDECLPAGTKVSPVSSGASVTFESVEAPANGKLLVAVDYINYDYDFHEAWEQGTNTRNATIAVNGGPATRWAFPLSGSDWFETGRLHVQLDGFVEGGENEIVFATFKDEEWAPDLVGLEILM
jgi:alpha-galactosidase